ncbi:secretin N-terminal domain-containing protein [Parasedimentitalea marina]|uniref:secretin N-terminal domain-containing protein n=1 Tax=Parasedimentitalea marina TaxID=2483033 RepID=UPI001EE7B476|nr:secretin N-terminal domain-containing protein [Parasedimentitalea marina]
MPEPQTNSLLVSAPRERIDEIVQMVRYLDRRPTQVLVEAIILRYRLKVCAISRCNLGRC